MEENRMVNYGSILFLLSDFFRKQHLISGLNTISKIAAMANYK
jgi:hypothetical protein